MNAAQALSQDEQCAQLDQLPTRVSVAEIVSSRYPNHQRPLSWDKRVEGIDVIRTDDGRLLRLLSDGGQSPPAKGWGLVISEGDAEHGYRWTLYSMPKGSEQRSYGW